MASDRSSAIAISVIIPCRNAGSVLAGQLEALSRQQCPRPWEVVVVDNGSSDDTRVVAERYRERLPNLRIVEASRRLGAAYARNVGVDAAIGENVAFCDADDEVGDGWLTAVDAALRENEFIAFRTETRKLNPRAPQRETKQSDGLQVYTYPPYLPYSGATFAVRRHHFLRAGGFDESMLACEDADFCWRLQLMGIPLRFAPDAVIHIRLRPTLWQMCRQAWIWGQYNVLLYKKFRPLGMPRLERVRGLRNLFGVLRRAFHVVDPQRRGPWLWQASWIAGRLVGSIRYRVWAL